MFCFASVFSDLSHSYEGWQPMKNCAVWNEDRSVAVLQPPLCCLFPVQLTNDQNSSNICQGSLLSHDVTKLCSALKWWWIYSGIFVTAQKSPFTVGFFSPAPYGLHHIHEQVNMKEQIRAIHFQHTATVSLLSFFFLGGGSIFGIFSFSLLLSQLLLVHEHTTWSLNVWNIILSKCGWCT